MAVCVASVSVEGYGGIVRYCILVYDIGTYPYLGAQGVWEYLRGMLEDHRDIDGYGSRAYEPLYGDSMKKQFYFKVSFIRS